MAILKRKGQLLGPSGLRGRRSDNQPVTLMKGEMVLEDEYRAHSWWFQCREDQRLTEPKKQRAAQSKRWEKVREQSSQTES